MTNSSGIETDLDRILKLQHELGRIMADVVDPMAGLNEALARVAAMPGVDGVWTWFRNSETGDFHLEEAVGLCDPLTLELDVFPAATPVGHRLMAREEVVGTWEGIWPEKAQVIRELGWRQVAVLPILSQGEVIGALGSGRKSAVCMKGNCLWVLRTLANATGALVTSIRNETQHRTLSENLGHMLDSITDRMFIVDPDGKVLYHNAVEMSGPEPLPHNLVGSDIARILPCFERLGAEAGTSAASPIGESAGVPQLSDLVDARGELHPVEVRIEAGNWNGARADIVICRDISGDLVMEQENLRMAAAIAQVAETVVITDAEGTITDVNPAFTRRTGYTRAEAIGQNPRLLKSGEHDDEFYRSMWRTLSSGENWTGRLTNRAKDGKLFIEDATLSPVKDARGVITHYVGVKRDVTAETKLDERLREAQKMEAVGTLAGGLAHDFNNILYALLGYTELALDDVPENHPARTPLHEVAKAGKRAAELVAKMLAFRRRGDGEHHAVVVSRVISDGVDLVRAALPKTVGIKTDLQAVECRIMADATELHQMLLNLGTNALHAMENEAGELSISVDQVEVDTAGTDNDLTPGNWVRIRVADNGRGIDPAVLERIFEPYFTTRKLHEGKGLGLATVRGIVGSHGGQIFVTSEPHKGTEFTIYLPLVTTGNGRTAGVGDTSDRTSIMVVDDEPLVLELLDKALTRAGFEVKAFRNGIEALEVFRAAPDSFEVVVTDLTMPNITGIELASEMLAIRPDLPLILTTGYGDKVGDIEAREAGIRYFMAKPLDIKELREAIRELTGTVIVS